MAFAPMASITCFSLNIALLLSLAYKIMTWSDLEKDHINPPDFVKKLNRLALPEIAVAGVTALLMLFSGHWFFFILNLPGIALRYMDFASGGHLLDPTNIHTQKTKTDEQKKIIMGMISCVVFFFGYLYCVVIDFMGDTEESVLEIFTDAASGLAGLHAIQE